MNYNKVPPKLDDDYDKLSSVPNDEIFEELLRRGIIGYDEKGNITLKQMENLKEEIKLNIRNHITKLTNIYGIDIVFDSVDELIDEYINNDDEDDEEEDEEEDEGLKVTINHDDDVPIEKQLNALHCRVAENYNDTMFSINMLEGDINDIMDKLNKLETRIQPSKTTAQ